MKFKDCTVRQKKAWKNVKYAAQDYIFGIENGCNDNSKESKEYKDYMDALIDLDSLKDVVYHEAITNVYDEGFCGFGGDAQSYMKDIRFCGKEFIMRLVNKYCTEFRLEAFGNLGISAE